MDIDEEFPGPAVYFIKPEPDGLVDPVAWNPPGPHEPVDRGLVDF